MKRAGLVLGLLASCAPGQIDTEPSRERLGLPDRASFEAVADALQVGCGTLDCHGQIGRNLRLYGGRGLRLRDGDTSATGATTAAEYEATYWSVVGLEPELLAQVLADRGAVPERLALIRKGRGVELHKGGTLMKAGDDLDRCLVTWLAGATATDRCQSVSEKERPVSP